MSTMKRIARRHCLLLLLLCILNNGESLVSWPTRIMFTKQRRHHWKQWYPVVPSYPRQNVEVAADANKKRSVENMSSEMIDQNDDDGRLAEIDALGGDPFFLTDDDVEGESTMDEELSEGPSPEAIMTLMTMSAKGPDVLNLTDESSPSESRDTPAVPTFAKKENMESGSYDDRLSELMDAGGDPFFLTDDDVEGDTTSTTEEELSEGPSPQAIMALMTMSAKGPDVMNLIDESSTSKSRGTPAKKEHTESESYDDRIAELMEAGGDPFFLTDDELMSTDVPEGKDTSFEEQRSEIAEMGGDAFLSNQAGREPDSDDEKKDGSVLSADAFMAMALSASDTKGGNVLDRIGKRAKSPPFPPSERDRKRMTYDDETADMEAANGGDAFFRTTSRGNGSEHDLDQLAEIEAMGGDAFFLPEITTTTNDEEAKVAAAPDNDLPSDRLMTMAMSGGGLAEMIGHNKEDLSTTTKHEDGGGWEWDGIVDEEAHLGFE
eukprot:scaffold2156_cov115-Cylindrotheca_fusiformis.AAC.3